MQFHWPMLLWSLLLPIGWLLYDLFRSSGLPVHSSGSKILQAEASAHTLRLQPATASRPPRFARLRWRFLLGLCAAIIALARPQWGRIDEPVFDQSREIILALDLSRSMLAPDVKPSRLERAKLLITSLLERLDGERIGLVVFAGTGFLQSPLSADYEILRDFLPSLTPNFLPQGGSNYEKLLQSAVDGFGATAAADRFLIILSDGEATDEQWKNLLPALKKKGIRILGLGIGTSAGAMIPDGSGGFVKDERGAVVLSRLEDNTLKQLARETDGLYVDASTWVDLAQLLSTTIEAGRTGQFLERHRVRLAERYQWALAPALIFLFWSFWREFPIRPRSRQVRLPLATAAGPATPPPLPPTPARTAALVLFTLLATVSDHPLPAADRDPSSTIAQPLTSLIAKLSARPGLNASDCAQMARTTLTYGEQLLEAKLPVPAGPVRDALLAVDQGEAHDARAADWPDLRAKLKKLLQKPEEPPKPPEPEKKTEKQNQDQKSDQQQKQDSKQKPDQKQDPPSKPDPKSDPQSKPGENASAPKPNQPSSTESKPSAFGEMQKPPAQPPAQPATKPEDTQKIGGSTEKVPPPPTSDELLVPLQKLEKVRNLDVPGQLFEALQNSRQPAPAEKPTKDW